MEGGRKRRGKGVTGGGQLLSVRGWESPLQEGAMLTCAKREKKMKFHSLSVRADGELFRVPPVKNPRLQSDAIGRGRFPWGCSVNGEKGMTQSH